MKILGCDRDDSLETIKANYKRLCLRFHPDKNNGESETFFKDNYTHFSPFFDLKNKTGSSFIFNVVSMSFLNDYVVML